MTEPKLYDLKTDLSLAAADRIIDTALSTGTEEGFLPLTVVVLDVGGLARGAKTPGRLRHSAG